MDAIKKSVAGYHILCLLSELDQDFNPKEGLLIVDYMENNFPIKYNFDAEVEFLSKLKSEEYLSHFTKAMDVFYTNSTEGERAKLIDFAVKLVKADNEITKRENVFLNELINTWDPNGNLV
ncbi:MAG: hypothetical protein RIQ89_912 [Bacteroidota bacterium]|jgi:DNA integrity scanning protein DisA with diadenylate cyclase activity